MDVDEVSLDSDFLSGHVHSRSGEDWWISVVYGPQGDDAKMLFLEQLSARRDHCHGPWMVLGDFNMILRALEKNNANLNRRTMPAFRNFLDASELREVYLHGRLFTWSNERTVPTLTAIDKV